MASPLLGYNTNVRHHGKLFHIQTEDSGVAHGHIFTHLFADGGRIIATKKTTYAHWIGTERYPGVVKKLMQAQHKAMFIALRDGLFDDDEVAGAAAFSAREIVLEDEEAAPGAATPAAPPQSPAHAVPSNAVPSNAVPSNAVSSNAVPSNAVPSHGAQAAPSASVAELDVDALERAAQGFLAEAPAYAPPAEPERAPKKAPSGRYAATQPAVRQRRTPPPAAARNQSVFGSDFLSEKSLDEVIMSYLAEDLESDE